VFHSTPDAIIRHQLKELLERLHELRRRAHEPQVFEPEQDRASPAPHSLNVYVSAVLRMEFAYHSAIAPLRRVNFEPLTVSALPEMGVESVPSHISAEANASRADG